MKNYIQIGANIGNDDFQEMVRNSNEKLRIFLVEPNLDLLPILSSNYTALNMIHDISIIPFGISLSKGETDFYLYGDINGNYSFLNRRTHPLASHVASKTVKTMTFEDLCSSYNIIEIECLFLDTEGLDYEILNSIDLSKINIKTIIFEEWPHENDDMNGTYRTGPSFLNEFLVPKFKDYQWEKIVLGGMSTYRLNKK